MQVRRMFIETGCVQGRFGAVDEPLAADRQHAGVSLETLRREILLGSVRRPLSLPGRWGAIRSLR